MSESAFKSTAPEVIEAYFDWAIEFDRQHARRALLEESVGRRLMIQRSGFGVGGTRVVGFERFESDSDGYYINHHSPGVLKVSSMTGQYHGMVVPNLRRKKGAEFADELRTYDISNITLPGCPTFVMYADVGGLTVTGPVLFHMAEGTTGPYEIYAYWPTDVGQRDPDSAKYADMMLCPPWESIPMSEYHLAKERLAAREQKENPDV